MQRRRRPPPGPRAWPRARPRIVAVAAVATAARVGPGLEADPAGGGGDDGGGDALRALDPLIAPLVVVMASPAVVVPGLEIQVLATVVPRMLVWPSATNLWR